jgi:hypothetical protein
LARRLPQTRSYPRALRQALAGLICLGRRTVSRLIWTNGGQQRSWSAEYFLHSRCRWEPQPLFATIWRNALPDCRGPYVGVAVDDTRLHKTGRRIRQAFFQRDPLSPPFHCNLMLGLRFLQASRRAPLHRRHRGSARALPVRFQEVSAVKRPQRNAPAEQWRQYRVAVKLHNLSRRFVTMMSQLRQALETAGGHLKTLALAVDGSFCNRTVFTAVAPGVELIARARSDSRLCFRAPEGSRRFYSPHKFTPEQIRQDKTIPWKIAFLFYGGKRRLVRYKELRGVYWQGGARKRKLRLLVVAPTPYRKRKSGRLHYRRPAFLLTTVLEGLAGPLLQIYFDRWQISKSTIGRKKTRSGWDRPSYAT